MPVESMESIFTKKYASTTRSTKSVNVVDHDDKIEGRYNPQEHHACMDGIGAAVIQKQTDGITPQKQINHHKGQTYQRTHAEAFF